MIKKDAAREIGESMKSISVIIGENGRDTLNFCSELIEKYNHIARVSLYPEELYNPCELVNKVRNLNVLANGLIVVTNSKIVLEAFDALTDADIYMINHEGFQKLEGDDRRWAYVRYAEALMMLEELEENN